MLKLAHTHLTNLNNMAGSLQDQLLSKGLINKNKAKKIQQAKHKQKKIINKHKVELTDENKAAAEQARKAKTEQDKQLNLQQKAKAQEKAIAAQIKQLIEANQIEVNQKDVVFIFSHNGKSQTLVVSREQETQLKKGRLSIVNLTANNSTNYQLVPTQIADKINTRNPDFIAYQADLEQLSHDEEDPYADYQIPDDLMW